MNAPAKRLVIVGLELGDGPALHAWARAGLLPAFQSLIKEGCWRWLETTADQLHISAWPSLYTGAVPGEHGVYYTHQPAPGLQGYQRFHPGIYGRPTFWSLLDEAGTKCTVFDPPYIHPEEGFKGTLVHDWGSWAHYLPTGSSPAGVAARIDRGCCSYPLGLEAHDLGFTPLDAQDISARLVKAVEAKTSATCWLMEQAPAALTFMVYGETHVAGHYCWPRAAAQPRDPAQAGAMLAVYQAIDRGIARIRASVPKDTLFVVVSGDGIGSNHAGWHLLPEVLERLGCAAKPGQPQEGAAAPPPPKGFDPVKALRDLLPKDFRKALARRLPTALRDKLAQRVDMADVDWSRTKAYCLPTDLEGCLRINLKGREPLGIVAPGAEYEALLTEIEAALRELVDPQTQRPLVKRIIRSDTQFPGHRRAWLPDLVVNWDASAPIVAASSKRVGVLSKPSPDPRPGTHTAPAFAVIAGPGVPANRTLEAGSILDLAPGALHWFGVAAPAHMRGAVWSELTN